MAFGSWAEKGPTFLSPGWSEAQPGEKVLKNVVALQGRKIACVDEAYRSSRELLTLCADWRRRVSIISHPATGKDSDSRFAAQSECDIEQFSASQEATEDY
jgi:hypothetical protein